MEGSFEKIANFVYTPGVFEIPDILKLKILKEVVELPYKKDYLQVLSLKKIEDFNLELTIKQERVNEVIKAKKSIIKFQVSKQLYENLDNYEKIYLIEDIYPKEKIVQTMLLPEEY